MLLQTGEQEGQAGVVSLADRGAPVRMMSLGDEDGDYSPEQSYVGGDVESEELTAFKEILRRKSNKLASYMFYLDDDILKIVQSAHRPPNQ